MAFVIILIISILIIIAIYRIRKVPPTGNMTLITGGIKTGKSTFSVHLAIRKLKFQRFKYYIKLYSIKFFKFLKLRKFRNAKLPEKPLLYSNIPLKVPYVPLTRELLLRQKRFNFGSVIYICEASLIADSMTFKDNFINENLLLFNKLIAHETHGGYIYYDTQSISDCHYSLKRCLSTYLHIVKTFKYCPFFLFMWVRECRYSEDNNSINVYQSDVEDSTKLIIVPKSVWKKFDCYAFSAYTDNLPIENKEHITVDLKVKDLISFKQYQYLVNKGVKKDE